MTKPKTIKMNLSALVEDFSFYPRWHVDMVNIRNLSLALEAGETLPAPVVTSAGRIVDGVNRCRAYRRVFGPDYEIDVEVRDYASDAELQRDAIAPNVGRGVDLSPWDRARCVELAKEHGVPMLDLAQLLHITTERLDKLIKGRMGSDNSGKPIPLKRSISHMVEKALTERQEEVNAHLSGMPALFHMNQLSELIESDLLEATSEHLTALSQLVALATNWIAEHQDEGEANVS